MAWSTKEWALAAVVAVVVLHLVFGKRPKPQLQLVP
jgi:hypothetical protein